MKEYLVRIALLLFVGLLFIPYANASEEGGLTFWHNVEFDDFDRKVYHDIYDYLDNVCYIAGFTDVKTVLATHPEWINQRYYDGYTPLHRAVIYNKPADYIKFLLDHAANVNCTDIDGLTPLHHAVLKRDFDTVLLLLSYNADVGYKDNSGRTPLDYSKREQYKEITKVLKKVKNVSCIVT